MYKKRVLFDNYDLSEAKRNDIIEYLLEEEMEPTDEAIWQEFEEENGINWDILTDELENFFGHDTYILRGTVGTWMGRREAGVVSNNFMGVIYKAINNCDYIKITDVNGHLYLECTHHDGTNCYEIKKLTDKGIDYLFNYENNWDETRSLQYVHDKIMERYSVLPNFAHKVYGLPKREVV